MTAIILFNKPYAVQSQFRNDTGNDYITLADFFDDKSLRIAGRLDATSEGLLILTGNSKRDGQINKAITHPPSLSSSLSPSSSQQSGIQQVSTQHHKTLNEHKQGKTYLVQVDGIATIEQLTQLSKGVMLKDGMTLPAEVSAIAENQLPMPLWQRHPPIRERKSQPTSWLRLTIYEGKNRQVRRMTASVGLPCLRLIRWSVAGFELGTLGVGEFVRVHLNRQRLAKLGL